MNEGGVREQWEGGRKGVVEEEGAHRSLIDPLQHVVREVNRGKGDRGPGDTMVTPLQMPIEGTHCKKYY